jgi:hypothetical protein
MLNGLRHSSGRPAPVNAASDAALDEVDRQLADRAAAPMMPTPGGLRGRILESLDESQPRQRRVLELWPLAAAACIAVMAGTLYMLSRPHAPAPVNRPGSLAVTNSLPLEPAGMIRLVTGTVDRPLRGQADLIMSDTRRATRAIVGCVPFAGRGG